MKITRSTWYRISKQDGTIELVSQLKVIRAATRSYHLATDVIAAGRFVTPFSTYSRAELLTDEERRQLRPHESPVTD